MYRVEHSEASQWLDNYAVPFLNVRPSLGLGCIWGVGWYKPSDIPRLTEEASGVVGLHRQGGCHLASRQIESSSPYV